MGRPGLTRHRKFLRLSRALGSPALARGVLELLWDACYEAGDDYLGAAGDLEALVGWAGESGALTRALLEAGQPEGVGFIEAVDSDAGRYRVHDLWHHAPDYVRKRRERELQRRKRLAPAARRRRSADSGRQPVPVGNQSPPSLDSQTEVDRTPAPSPSPSPKERDARARGPRYAYQGRALAITPGQHDVLLRMANGVDLDWIGEVYPRWDRELQASGAPNDPLLWCLARLKQRLRIGRDGQGPPPVSAEDEAVLEELAAARRAKSQRDEARQAEREELAEGVLPLLTDDERATVEAAAVEALEPFRLRLTAPGYQEALARARRRALLEQASEADLKARVRAHLKATKPLRLRPSPTDEGGP